MSSKAEYWDLMVSFFEETQLVHQHLDSFNDFIDRRLQQIIDEVGEIQPEIPRKSGIKQIGRYYLKLGKVKIGKPSIREADGSKTKIFPNEARTRDLTYSAPIELNVIPVDRDEKTGIEEHGKPENVYIGELPIMLKSKACLLYNLKNEKLIEYGEDPRDPGGYFIINGSERVLVTQEDLAPNRVLVEEARRSSTSSHIAKVFSTSRGFRAPVQLERRRDSSLHVTFPSVPGRIPLAILMRALGFTKDREIAFAISRDHDIQSELRMTLEAASPLYDPKNDQETHENALDYIGKRVAVGQTREYRIQRAQQVLDRYLLPHIGRTEKDRKRKSYFLAQMADRLLQLVSGKRTPDDKDHYSNKRLKLAGDLLTSLFRVAFLNLFRDIKYQLERAAMRGRKPNIKTAVRADVITERLRHALATGNWVGGKAGVSQLLDRTNYLSSLSHLRRVVSPLSRSQPHFEARDLHPTHYGRICPNETPEGPNCGLVKNLALMAHISVGTDEVSIESLLYGLAVEPVEGVRRGSGGQGAAVFLNGRLIGYHNAPRKLVSDVRNRRRRGEVDPEMNIALHYVFNEVQVNCDPGRVRRPLMIADGGKSRLKPDTLRRVRDGDLSFNSLIKQGMVEYLDTEEEENAFVAMHEADLKPEHTHLEIAPSTILGICASVIPYPEHNQSPRNTYEAGMAKQALGLPMANFKLRLDTRSHLLHYPQKPIVNTTAMDVIGFDRRPAGQNFVIAILSYEGYNMEDALVLNKSSIQRGLARSTFFRNYRAEERRYPGGQEDHFEIPDKNVRGYRESDKYRHLGEDGIIEPEVKLHGGEVLIGRTSPPRFLEEYREFDMTVPVRRETSVDMRHGEEGIVDMVVLSETVDGNRLVKIKVRDQRQPELGDKFASRHGQKGVIGLLVPQEDMPFTEMGVVPDLILNPHAIPSRMTLGQTFESVSGKAGAAHGTLMDGTAFKGLPLEELGKLLQKAGFKYNGQDVMYNGMTGEKFNADIFTGLVYYQKLHHLVRDKMHARARGPVQILTRQPTEGRAREGGLRFGEMERDCLIGHGAALLLKERLLEESDKSKVLICTRCGLLAVHDRNRDRYYCHICEDKGTIAKVVMSYAFKLLLQELMSLGIAPRLQLKDMA